MRDRLLVSGAMLLALSCSSNGGGPGGSGGSTGSGGVSSASGGITGSGGKGSGGTSSGGAPAASGGATGSSGGGATGTSSGGATASGGASATGGTGAPGGATGVSTGGTGAGGRGNAGGNAGGQHGGSGGSPSAGGASGSACARADLQAAANAYLTALVAHDPTMAPLADGIRYTENTAETKIGDGLWKTAGALEMQRDLIDTVQCMTVSQVVLPESGTDIVFTQRLKVDGGKITESEAVITRPGDWNFDAMGYLNTKSMTWSILSADQQTPRATLITMPKLYWDYFKANTSPMPPFGTGCKRVEGGKGTPVNCTTGIPSGVNISDRRYFADEEQGISAGVSVFGSPSGLLDVHYFVVISGTIREVYAMTVNTSYMGTGWPGGVN